MVIRCEIVAPNCAARHFSPSETATTDAQTVSIGVQVDTAPVLNPSSARVGRSKRTRSSNWPAFTGTSPPIC